MLISETNSNDCSQPSDDSAPPQMYPTGEMMRMDVRGENGVTMKEKWAEGPRTYLPLQTLGFPNFFMVNGAVFCNFTRCAEVVTECVGDCITDMRKNGFERIQPYVSAEDAWTQHSMDITERMLFTKTNSWFMGNNVKGKSRGLLFYAGGAPVFREKIANVMKNNYAGFSRR